MPSNLKFEYPTRWPQLGEDLLSKDPAKQKAALVELDNRDRWLEDHWGIGTSGTVPSLISITPQNDSFSSLNTSGIDITTVTVTSPADTGFTYWVDISSFIRVAIDDDNSGATKYIGFFGYFREDFSLHFQTGWGFGGFVQSSNTSGIGFGTNGIAGLTIAIGPGETHTYLLNVQNNAPSGQPLWTASGTAYTFTKLFAIPV